MQSSNASGRLSKRHRRAPHAAALALTISAGFAACGFDPQPAPMRFHLNASTVAALESDPAIQDQIRGGLEMLFGTPAHPRFLLTPEWKDDSFDPNHADRPADDGGTGEITSARAAELLADNRRAFARELDLIAQGRYADVRAVKAAPDLNRDYRALLARHAAGEVTDGDLATEARQLFESFYPTLQDSAELYRQQCLHCHGVEGGGDGPTSSFLDPRPRDYRKGVFKFTAVKDKARPRREDIYRVLEIGVYGTAMPSFKRFSMADREGLTDYVRLLAQRGEVEHRLVSTFADEEELSSDAFTETYTEVWEKWQEAKTKVVSYDGEVPAVTPELLARGREIFNDAKKGNCASCHGELGLGDGVAAFKLDDHGKKVSAYTDDWGHPILPRNLQQGLYRGGGRPIDIYRRIYAGINGGPMPAIGESKDAEGNLVVPPQDLWALVHYVRSLAQRDESVVHAGAALHGHSSDAGSASHGGDEPASDHGSGSH
jgi:mono/diheme cytochrome c family protein